MRLILLSRVSSQSSSLCSLASMLHQSSCSLHNAVLCRRKKWGITPGHTVEIRIDDSSMGYIIDEGSKLGRQSVKASDLLGIASKGNVRNEIVYLLNATKPWKVHHATTWDTKRLAFFRGVRCLIELCSWNSSTIHDTARRVLSSTQGSCLEI